MKSKATANRDGCGRCKEKEALGLLRQTSRTVSYAGITRIRFEGYLRPPLRFPAATTPTVARLEYTAGGSESQETRRAGRASVDAGQRGLASPEKAGPPTIPVDP